MGCCRSELKCEPNNIPKTVKECIEKNSIKTLLRLIESKEFATDSEKILNTLDKEICNIKQLRLNALGYALFLGRSQIFQLLHKTGCSLQATEMLLQKHGIPLITLICSKGYSDILSYYLPFYVAEHQPERTGDRTFTIDFNIESEKAPPKTSYTAIQLAVQYGHITIVTIVNEYFKNISEPPVELDLEHQDEASGENCALIACRYGNYPMVKFLHQKCGVNFMIFNKLGESPVQMATAGSRLHPHLPYLQIITYLADIVGVNIRHNYEETLLLAEDKEIIVYLEKKLKGLGINAKKVEIEKAGSEPDKGDRGRVEEGFENVESRRFNFMTMYAVSCGDKDDSLVSSISDRHSVNSLFGSTLSEFHK